MNIFYKLFLTLGELKKKIIEGPKNHYKSIIPFLIAILLPWILTLIFIISLDLTHGLSDELIDDPILFFRIMIFYTFNLTYMLPFFGNGFWPCIVVWAIPGLLVGLIPRKNGNNLNFTMLGLGTNCILYSLIVTLFSFPNDMNIDPMISPRLYSDISPLILIYLLYHISFYSFVLPVVIIFTLIGNKINPKRRYPTPQIKSQKVILEKEIPLQAIPKLEPTSKIEKNKKLRGFAKVIYKQFNPLNDNEVFKEKFKKISLKFLLNPIDQLKAAIIIFDTGTVDVHEYKKITPLMKMDKKEIEYNAMLQVTTEMLLNIAMGKMSVVQLLIAERKDKNIKVKGKLKLLKLLKALKLLSKS